MDPEKFQILLAFFKSMADETRLRIIGMLSEHECSVEELATRLGLKEPTISHHLSKLKELNLVTLRKEGNNRFYRFESGSLHRFSKDLLSVEEIASPEESQAGERWEQKIFAAFVKDNQIIKLPASRKKREVLLKWIVQRFELEQRYSEADVNAIIREIHEDVFTIRRELIATGFMERENNVYWRLAERVQKAATAY